MTRSTSRERRLWLAVTVSGLVAVAEVAGGVSGRSLGLLSDAAHNGMDVVGLGLAALAVRLARRSPTLRRSYGLHRAGILSALVNALLMVAIGGALAVGAVERLVHPGRVSAPVVLAVATGSLVANAAAAWWLREPGRELNVAAARLHLVADAAGSGAVAVAGLVILAVGGGYRLDPAVSLLVAVLILAQTWRLVRDSVNVLLESAPSDIDVATVRAAMLAAPGVEQVHDLHMWSLSSEVHALSAHLVLSGAPNLADAQRIGDRVRALLTSGHGIAHATLELECDPCLPTPDPCALDGLEAGRPAT